MTDADPGYSMCERLLEQADAAEIGCALDRAGLPRTRAGARHVLRIPAVRALAQHPSLVALAASFVGANPVPFRATLFDKSAAANWLVAWHQDVVLPLRARSPDPEWGPWSTKAGVVHAVAPAAALSSIVALRVHLDASTRTNGPLRVLPGTHRDGVLPQHEIERRAATIPAVECLSPAGGVVAMRPLILHASSKAIDDRPRRVLHIEYAARVRFGADVELAVG